MLDLVKKSMLTGIGLALRTWDEVEGFVKDFQKQTEMSEAEGRRFLDEARQRYDEAQDKLEKQMEKSIQKLLKKTKIPTIDDINQLKTEIDELKRQVQNLGS